MEEKNNDHGNNANNGHYELPTEDMFKGNPIELRYTQDKGRIMIATRDIEPGESILRSAPFVYTVCDDNKYKICSGCWKENSKLQACACNEVAFCNDACKLKSQHYNSECAALSHLHDKEFTVDEYSEIRMVVRSLSKRFATKGRKREYRQYESMPGLQFYEPTFEDTFSLIDNESNTREDVKNAVQAMAEHTFNIFPKEESLGATQRDIFLLFLKERCNCFGIWNPDYKCLASAVYTSASFFNHSCFPNCTRYPDAEDLISIRALYEIKKGSQLCITYIPLHPSKERRQLNLLLDYHFNCDCIRCTDTTEKIDKEISKYFCPRTGCNGLIVWIPKSQLYKCRLCTKEVKSLPT